VKNTVMSMIYIMIFHAVSDSKVAIKTDLNTGIYQKTLKLRKMLQ
jgi:hypothetical protein